MSRAFMLSEEHICTNEYGGKVSKAKLPTCIRGPLTRRVVNRRKVSKAKPPTCIRGLLTRRVVNRGMCTSGRDLKERANRPTSRTDLHNISVKICPHTKIEPALPEDFSPRHLKPYQLVYTPGDN
ncbi:Uncharacterized protein Fot_30381 [Forsythia ovata]|uniref:Uncharacterized protein n=1 Tax=Forsythia ovata TaxID=205694 RepID=A0ABD1TVE3_9LAMI